MKYEKGNVTLEVADDKFSAYITIKESDDFISETDITKLFKEAGITHGINNALDNLRKTGFKKKCNVPFLVAHGSVPDTEYEVSYAFEFTNCVTGVDVNSLKELTGMKTIKADMPMANIIFSDGDGGGINIFGENVKQGIIGAVNVDKILGKNVYFLAETNQVFSKKSGYPYLKGNKLNVKSEFILPSIDNEQDLKLFGDYTINENITESQIMVEGDLRVNGSILNCKANGILINGNADIVSAENSKIICSGDINLAGSVSSSFLSAGESITGNENSSIAGGITQCGKNVKIGTAGSPFGISTNIEVAANPYLKEYVKVISKEKEELIKSYGEDSLDVEKKRNLQFLAEKKMKKQMMDILAETEPSNSIAVDNNIYPGTVFRIYNHSLNISEEITRRKITISDKSVTINEY
jgi:hypothetical protein